jgi:hypothetical protein
MIRKALIIYCDSTKSGNLTGPVADNNNFVNYLQNPLGGHWRSSEILSLRNPTYNQVRSAITGFMSGADYTFTVFSGHGYISTEDNRQYMEIGDDDIGVTHLKTDSARQTIIIDACRGFYTPVRDIIKGFSETYDSFSGDVSTRKIFDNAVSRAESGLTVLYAANVNQSALDTDKGGVYLYSLLKISDNWVANNREHNILDLNVAHRLASDYLDDNFDTIQVPTKNKEKRINYFPFAVKFKPIYG